jgi:pimeloyl-ACP methyl ester carboxylesterase
MRYRLKADSFFICAIPLGHRCIGWLADWQEYFRKQHPPTLITWGKNDAIFTVEGAELFKRDIPSAELHFLDTGHFALEEELDRIGSLMHEFLDRTINKK